MKNYEGWWIGATIIVIVLLVTVVCVAVVTTASSAPLYGDATPEATDVPEETDVPETTEVIPVPPTEEQPTAPPTEALHPTPTRQPPEFSPTITPKPYPPPDHNGGEEDEGDNHHTNGEKLPTATALPETGGADKFNEPDWLVFVLSGSGFMVLFLFARIIRWGSRR